MPTLKLKKATDDYIAEKERERIKEKEKNGSPNKKKKPQSRPEKKILIDLDAEVLPEKRKRTVPPSEKAAIDWINEHLESKPGFFISLVHLYAHYANACQITEAPSIVVDRVHFHKLVDSCLGKEFVIKDSSPLKYTIREQDIHAVKEKLNSETKEKFDGASALEEVFKELGNSRKGFRFPKIMKGMCAKNPKIKKGTVRKLLNCGISRKKISIINGIGYAGVYRLTSKPSESETEEQEYSEEKKSESNGNTEGDSKLQKKKKDTETSGSEESDQKSEGKRKVNKRNRSKFGMSRKVRKKIVKKMITLDSINHSDPKRLEDIFPLAITFGCEPKETTVPKIKRYISTYYPSIDVEKKLQKALNKGVQKGAFHKISTMKYRLLVDEFDPYNEDNIQECIVSAILASNEPKVSSVSAIRKYIQDYHKEFLNKPTELASALKRACDSRILRKISGIGATGSVQLLVPFTPSPCILAGDEEIEEIQRAFLCPPEYIAKPSKSRSSPMDKVEELRKVRPPPRDRSKVVKPKDIPHQEVEEDINGGSDKDKSKVKAGKTKGAAKERDTRRDSRKRDSREEDGVEVIKPRQNRVRGSTPGTKVSKGKTDTIPVKEEEEEEEEPPARATKRTRPKQERKPSVSRERRGLSNVSYCEEESEVDESDEDEPEPSAKKSRRKK